MMEYAIEINDLVKKYKDFTLDNVSLQVPKGCIMGFVGQNGAGKSTTIKAVLNLINKDSGEIKIFGKDNKLHEKELKEDIGVVFDDNCFCDSFRIEHVEKVYGQIYKNWDAKLFYEYQEKFRLPKDKCIKDFSRGMRMKLAIATALSHHAKLLILDEATSGLDPIVRDEILDIFLEFIQDENHTVFISSHIISDLEKIADYITFIHEGKVMFCEMKDTLIEEYGLAKLTQMQYEQLDKEKVVGVRRNKFGVEALIKDKSWIRKFFPNIVIDSVGIEDIILYIVKGEK